MENYRNIKGIVLFKHSIYYWTSIGCYVLASISILVVPLVNIQIRDRFTTLSWIIALVFWIGNLAGVTFMFLSFKYGRIIDRCLLRKKIVIDKKIGIIAFFSNPVAIIWDLLLTIAFVLLLIVIIVKSSSKWLIVFTVWLLFLSSIMHSMFNGKNYKHIRKYKNDL